MIIEHSHATFILPYGFARRNGVILSTSDQGALDCIHRGTPTLETIVELQRLVGANFNMVAAGEPEFQQALQRVYRDRASQAAEAAAAADNDLTRLADTAAGVDDLLDQSDDSPVVRLINALLLEAVKEGASDIHIETQEKRVMVRFRVDGVLRDVIEPKRSLGPLLVSRIKVMARLDIAEKRLPHDGRVTLGVGGREIDVRVSTVPSQYSERVVMRLLDRGATQHDLTSLGMSPRDLAVFERMLKRPNGILLVTGPTGSGKTTTLYAALSRLNDRTRNIMTVEDPIEYAVEGVGQIQVNTRTDLTFARGLRAILRQDPDVIMVGEIRDSETAQIAVQSSMTGHFVMSTLHTNSAVGSVTRLIDMGVERFLLAPMLSGLVAQRLVRRLCPECAQLYAATDADRHLMGGVIEVGETLYRSVGCPACRNEGYRGRSAIYEVVEIGDQLEAMIHGGASEADLIRVAREAGPSLIEDGAAKVRAGITSVDEVVRVGRDD